MAPRLGLLLNWKVRGGKPRGFESHPHHFDLFGPLTCYLSFALGKARFVSISVGKGGESG